jgi:hypothetical protein
MPRKLIDCRAYDIPRLDGAACSIVLVGDEDQLFVEALEHGRAIHGMEDTTELRDLVRSAMSDAPSALA